MNPRFLTTQPGGGMGGNSTPRDQMPLIERAEIVSVDSERYLVSAVTLTTGRRCRDLDISGECLDRNGGFLGGIPEIGSMCLLCFTSDSHIPVILKFLPYTHPTNAGRGSRPQGFPGDKFLVTSTGNGIRARLGGVVEVLANAVTKRLYVPLLNQIRDICENYILQTAAGILKYELRRNEFVGGDRVTEKVERVKARLGGDPVYERRSGGVTSVQDMPSEVVDWERVGLEEDPAYSKALDADGNLREVSKGSELRTASGHQIVSFAEGVILTTEDVSDFSAAVSKSRGHVRLTSADGVELGRASEAAVKGDTLKSLLDEYHSALNSYILELDAGLSGLSAVPGAAAIATATKAASAKAQLQLGLTNKKFQTFLAQDTKLS